MQIVIPMSGFGERFRRAGYTVPKPLIEVDGKPIIAHVLNMFPGETDVTFICNEEHLADERFQMRRILEDLCPSARIASIVAHRFGPVHAVQQVIHLLDIDKPVIVNYCDFSCFWDWSHFKDFVAASECEGAIPAYRGFHPHSLGTTNYAYLRQCDGWATDIQEKKPFTDNRMQEYASSGSYYFASARLMFNAFQEIRARDLSLAGEYYVSLAYKPLFERDAKIAVYPLQHFLQWGTPEDLRDYQRWSDTFGRLVAEPRIPSLPMAGSLVVPMAGLGERFSREGYRVPKPLIEVSGRPMVVQAALDLPCSVHQAFVLRNEMPGGSEIVDLLQAEFPAGLTLGIPGVTAGQACTAAIGVSSLVDAHPSASEEPVTIGACDSGCLLDPKKFSALLHEHDVDVVVWVARGHPHAITTPQMYGWIDESDGIIRAVSVKQALASPETDPIVIGTFTFRTPAVFSACVQRMFARDARVNNEFYLDMCINDAIALGLDCRIFEVDSLISWGTPNDLKTFEYWQSCFHKLSRHPYRLELDNRVPPEKVAELSRLYMATIPSPPVDANWQRSPTP